MAAGFVKDDTIVMERLGAFSRRAVAVEEGRQGLGFDHFDELKIGAFGKIDVAMGQSRELMPAYAMKINLERRLLCEEYYQLRIASDHGEFAATILAGAGFRQLRYCLELHGAFTTMPIQLGSASPPKREITEYVAVSGAARQPDYSRGDHGSNLDANSRRSSKIDGASKALRGFVIVDPASPNEEVAA